MFSKDNTYTKETQIIFRLEDENDVRLNKCYNYNDFPNDVSLNKNYDELFKLKEELLKIDFFTYDQKEKINELISQRNGNGLQEFIYTELNCVIQIYNYNSNKWTFILDNNDELSVKSQMKFIEWGNEGSLKCVRESGGMIKERIFSSESGNIKDKNGKIISFVDNIRSQMFNLTESYDLLKII